MTSTRARKIAAHAWALADWSRDNAKPGWSAHQALFEGRSRITLAGQPWRLVYNVSTVGTGFRGWIWMQSVRKLPPAWERLLKQGRVDPSLTRALKKKPRGGDGWTVKESGHRWIIHCDVHHLREPADVAGLLRRLKSGRTAGVQRHPRQASTRRRFSDAAIDNHVRQFLRLMRRTPELAEDLRAVCLQRRSSQVVHGVRWDVFCFLLTDFAARDVVDADFQIAVHRKLSRHEERRVEDIGRRLVRRVVSLGLRGRWLKAAEKHSGFAHLCSSRRLSAVAEAREFLDSIRLADLLTSAS